MDASYAIPEITSALATFISDSAPYRLFNDELDMRSLAAELQLLPVILDTGGCLGLRPNGDVMSFLWDKPSQLRREVDERIRNMAYHRASLKYPELVSLAPGRPVSAVDCPHCGGTGVVKSLPEPLASRVVCCCGGLGWLPGK